MKNVTTLKRERTHKLDDKIWSVDELNQFLKIVDQEEPFRRDY